MQIEQAFLGSESEVDLIRAHSPIGLSREKRLVHDNSDDHWIFACSSPEWMNILSRATKYSQGCAPVSIVGECGTGKQRLAHHMQSLGKSDPTIRIACGKLAAELNSGSPQVLQDWNQTLDKVGIGPRPLWLLDGIEEIPLAFQPLFVELVSEIRCTHSSQFSVVATSRHPLFKLKEEGKIREDLYYAITVLELVIPPLRERRGDIRTLVAHFSESRMNGCPPVQFSRQALEILSTYDWPGNVSELQNVICRIRVLADRRVVDSKQLSDIWKIQRTVSKDFLSLNLEDAETQLIL